MKAAALRGALSDRARGGNVHVLSSLVGGDTPSTKTARKALAAVSTAKNILVVLGRDDVVGWLSLRNVPEVHLLTAGQLNTYDVLVSDDVVFTREALEEFLDGARPTAARSETQQAATPEADAPKAGRHAAAGAPTAITADEPTDAAADEPTDSAPPPPTSRRTPRRRRATDATPTRRPRRTRRPSTPGPGPPPSRPNSISSPAPRPAAPAPQRARRASP